MPPLRWERRPDGLRAPALVCAFKGWNDAGEAASSALTFMGAGLDAARFATIDPEEFLDFQATRPMVKLVDGLSRRIEWPEWEIFEARVPRAPRDLVILSGPEPSHRWRTFSGLVTELAEALGVQLVVCLGALLADVPHYVAVAPNPKGALALLRRLESLVGVTVDASQLESAAADYESQVTRAVEMDPEVQAFVERLERA